MEYAIIAWFGYFLSVPVILVAYNMYENCYRKKSPEEIAANGTWLGSFGSFAIWIVLIVLVGGGSFSLVTSQYEEFYSLTMTVQRFANVLLMGIYAFPALVLVLVLLNSKDAGTIKAIIGTMFTYWPIILLPMAIGLAGAIGLLNTIVAGN